MEIHKRSSWLLLLLGISLLAATLQGVQGEAEQEGPSESECRPYIEKALKELETGEDAHKVSSEDQPDDSKEDAPTVEITTDDSDHQDSDGEDDTHEVEGADEAEEAEADDKTGESDEKDDGNDDSKEPIDAAASAEDKDGDGKDDGDDTKSDEVADDDKKASTEAQDEPDTKEDIDSKEDTEKSGEQDKDSKEDGDDKDSTEDDKKQSGEDDKQESTEGDKQESTEDDKAVSAEDDKAASTEDDKAESAEDAKAESTEDDTAASAEDDKQESKEDDQEGNTQDSQEDKKESAEDEQSKETDAIDSKQDDDDSKDDEKPAEAAESKEGKDDDSKENADDTQEDTNDTKEDTADSKEDGKSVEDDKQSQETDEKDDDKDSKESVEHVQADEAAKPDSKEDDRDGSTENATDAQSKEDDGKDDGKSEETSKEDKDGDDNDDDDDESGEAPEEELILEMEVPDELRPREHVEQLLKLDDESLETEKVVNRISEITLRDLKKLYENAIKPLEVLYKYRDLSNRHFGDSEIFSKPLILFMGPWSGGKSSIINYLLENEYNETSLRTGAEPSPAYFNIMTHGDEPEVIEGTQLAADFTFSGLQKFGQGLEERLRGHKLPRKLLEKVNIVEIPGILEVRKQVSRVFPFNDACQWFIDRADIIFLVYDPSKLDVGPETEAILDQLKGREHQTRIILNKADQVKPEELMRVQGALIWNISPLMSSAQPPVMYTTSLWSRPYEPWAPVRLLQAQERAFLRDLRSAIDRRIENKIASARRFAVRVRNHAKMVDCYLTTYYNHKSVFGNKKQVADEIIEHPQDYHIYEGLSTLTNISRYDLPDPEVYRDFFKLNPLYEFQQLSATCTYFRGCPINRLDIAIAYDLPELVGKHRRLVESALAEATAQAAPGS